jgi:hypothetical protein
MAEKVWGYGPGKRTQSRSLSAARR